MRRPLAPIALVGLLSVLAIAVPTPAVAADDDGQIHKAVQVYELQPEAGRVRVTIDVTVRNNIANQVTYEDCYEYIWLDWIGWHPILSKCPRTTRFYVNETYLWIEEGATNLRFSANAGSVSKSALDRQAGFTQYKLKFSRILKGQTRTIRATYDLPSAAPRSSGGIRAGRAYASFCVTGNGLDSGEIRVVVPAAFTMEHRATAGLTFKQETNNGRSTFTSGTVQDPVQAAACFSGTNAEGYTRTSIAGAGGRSVVVESWPEDPDWLAAVTQDVSSALPMLTAAIGRSLPGSGPITVREVSSEALAGYAGMFDPQTSLASVGENFNQSGLVAHELSHAWFNKALFEATWLAEGHAGWAEGQAGGASCDRLPPYPGLGSPDLEDWQYVGPKATTAEHALVDYQYEASCWVVSSVAREIGSDKMRSVLSALFTGTSAYGATNSTARAPVTWRQWLDAVDELGMVPAGQADFESVQRRLIQVGVATDVAELDARARARTSYHALLAETVQWDDPEVILAALTDWEFAAADRAVDSASETYAATVQAAQLVPEADLMTSPVKEQWEGAKTATALEATRTLAREQLQAAHALNDARVQAANLEFIAQLGLAGTDLQPRIDEAIARLRAADPSAAMAAVDQMADALAAAEGTGWLRLAVAVVIVIIMVLALFLWSRRRTRLANSSAAPVNWLGGSSTVSRTLDHRRPSDGTTTMTNRPHPAKGENVEAT